MRFPPEPASPYKYLPPFSILQLPQIIAYGTVSRNDILVQISVLSRETHLYFQFRSL